MKDHTMYWFQNPSCLKSLFLNSGPWCLFSLCLRYKLESLSWIKKVRGKDKTYIWVLRHQVQLCTRTPNTPWSLRCVSHCPIPVGRLYLWKEWNTHTTVDTSSTKTLTIPFSSSRNVHSLPPRIEPLVLLWISKNPTGGFPETHLTISHDERDLTQWKVLVHTSRNYYKSQLRSYFGLYYTKHVSLHVM